MTELELKEYEDWFDTETFDPTRAKAAFIIAELRAARGLVVSEQKQWQKLYAENARLREALGRIRELAIKHREAWPILFMKIQAECEVDSVKQL